MQPRRPLYHNWPERYTVRVFDSALREETRKSGDYFVSNKIVYGVESLYANIKVAPGAKDWLSEYDLSLGWLEFQIRLLGEGDSYFAGVIEVAPFPFSDSRNVKLHIDGVNGHDHMLVGNTEFIENPEEMIFERSPSVIRLQAFDDRSRGGKNVLHGIPETLLRVGRGTSDWKGSVGARLGDSEQSKLPCELIQARPKAVREFSSQNTDNFGEVLRLKANDVDGIFNVILARDGVRVRLNKLCNLPIEFIKLHFRPIGFNFEIGNPGNWTHG